MLNNPLLSDCKIICGTRTWLAHKVILAGKSEYGDEGSLVHQVSGGLQV